MKDQLCRAFCDGIRIRDVPAGVAISTSFLDSQGDRVGLYVVKLEECIRIRDNGTVLASLEASGYNLKSDSRTAALHDLMSDYGVTLDKECRSFGISVKDESSVAGAALRFTSFLLRVGDLTLLVERRVSTTFREDAERVLKDIVGTRASLEERTPLSPNVSDFLPDYLVRAPSRVPVGIFLGTSDIRVHEALFVHMRLKHEVHENCTVTVLIEHRDSISRRVHQQAVNRLDAVAEFRGDELAAAQRALGSALDTMESLH